MKMKMKLMSMLVLAVVLTSGCVSYQAISETATTQSTARPATQQETSTTLAAGTTTTIATAAPKTVDVEIRNYAFSPKTITINKGDTIRFTNFDSVEHSATSDTGKFDSGLLSQGLSWSVTFTEPGTYNYHCSPHPYMKATVVVV